MLTLIKKELRYLFCKPFFLAVISVLNLVPVISFAVFLKISQSQSAYAGFENIVSLMVLFFAVAIPIVSVISVCRDKKLGTDEFLFSMPISRATVTLSKILSLIIFFLVPTVITAVLPILFKSFGVVNMLHAYTSVVMLIAFEAFVITLSVMIAAKKGKALIASIIAYCVLILSFALGVLSSLVRLMPFGTGFDKIFGGILFELSVFKKADTVVYELFDWTALVFFVVGAVVFTVIAITELKRKATLLVSVLLVACVGVLPMLLPYSVRQIDINEYSLYTTSASAKKYISSVDEEITLYLIDPYTNEQELYNAIIRTAEVNKNIKLQIVNSAEDKDILQKYGLQGTSQESLSYAMIVESSKRWTFLNGQDYFSYYNNSMGHLTSSELEYRYTYCATLLNQYYSYYDQLSTEMQEALQKCAQIMSSLQNETYVCLDFESAFADALSYVTAEMIPTVYFIEGHGEEGTVANPYNLKEDPTIPENADTLVINSPSEDYTEGEIKALIDYVEKGGKLYILTDLENYSMPNFMSLLSYYGLSVENELVTSGEKTLVMASLNKEHEAFSAMSAKEVTVKDVSKVTVAENTKYTYSPMLSYQYTDGEGESANTVEFPVAVAVCEGEQKKVTLFTGATTFNTADNGLTEEELERVSPCVTNVMSWMFDEFESDFTHTPPKLYQKSLYLADDGQITKITVIFTAIVLAIALSAVAYIIARGLRSKRAGRSDEYLK